MGDGWNHILAGLAAVIAIPGVALGLGLPFPVAIVVGLVVYAGIALLAAPRRAKDRIVFGQSGQAQAELVAGLIEEGEAAVGRLREASRGLRSKESARLVGHLAEVARGILDQLASEPEKLAAVRRFLTYYLPRSAEIAEGLGLVERQRVPDQKRQQEITATLGKLDQAFTFYADSFASAELDVLDVELKLLGRSLAEDLVPTAEKVPVTRKDA